VIGAQGVTSIAQRLAVATRGEPAQSTGAVAHTAQLALTL